jgi:hypothetical protein
VANSNHRLKQVRIYPQPGLFPNLPDQGLLDRFTGLNLATRKLKQTTLMNMVRPTGDQYLPITKDNTHRNVYFPNWRHNQVRYSALMVT